MSRLPSSHRGLRLVQPCTTKLCGGGTVFNIIRKMKDMVKAISIRLMYLGPIDADLLTEKI
jgi:hypothetical protein